MTPPKFKIGDIVWVREYNQFIDHVCIESDYWESLYYTDLIIADSILMGTTYYYKIKNVYYSWKECFLKQMPYLPEELFDI